MIQDVEQTDARLLKAWALQRDQQALAALIDRYSFLVMGVCRRQCRNVTDAEDAFQVTFLILARSSQSIRNAVALPAWLHATAYRVAVRTRQRQRLDSIENLDCYSTIEDPFSEVARRHELRVLDEELEQLPEHLRAPLILHYLDGQAIAAVAQQLGTTTGSVRGRVQRGKSELRRRLMIRGVSLSAALFLMKGMNVATAATTQSALAIDALAQGPTAYLPRPLPDPRTIDIPGTSSYLVSSSSGAIMRTFFSATILSLGLTLWGSHSSELQERFGSPFGSKTATNKLAIHQPTDNTSSADLGSQADPLFQIDSSSAARGQSDIDENDPFKNTLENSSATTNESFEATDDVPVSSEASSPEANTAAANASSPNPSPFTGGQMGGMSGMGAGGMGGMGGGGMGGMGGGMGGMGGGIAPASIEPPPEPEPSEYEIELQSKLQEQHVDSDVSASNIHEFADAISSGYGIPVVVRIPKAAEGVVLDRPLDIQLGDTPLGIALKNALRPSKLKAIIRDDAVMIVPDTVALAQEGIGTARYVNVDDSFVKRMEQELSETTSISWNAVPLDKAMETFAEEVGIPIIIDTRALEDVGLTRDVPITTQLSDTTYETGLQLALRDNDLRYRPDNGYIRITTQDENEYPDNMLIRIYWLDGTGFRTASSAMQVIQSTVSSDTWETMGGPSSMQELRNSASGRIALVINASYSVHRNIEKLLDSLRAGESDPYLTPLAEPTSVPMGVMGGMGGGMGGMGGMGGGMM